MTIEVCGLEVLSLEELAHLLGAELNGDEPPLTPCERALLLAERLDAIESDPTSE